MDDIASLPSVTKKSALPVLTPTPKDWLFLAFVVLLGGSSFSGIRIAVETAPPAVVGAGRLWVAAIFLTIYMFATGRRFPPLIEQGRPSPAWAFALAIAATGYSVPMFLFPFAQQSVSSLLAGIYMAFMPLVTVVLAALFADEPLTRNKILGTLLGLTGVMALILPAFPADGLNASVIAQLALIIATTGYAISSVMMRRAPQVAARSFGAMVLVCAAILLTPFAIHTYVESKASVSGASMAAIFYLGVLPTGLSTICIIHMIRSAGASFLAVANYVTPGAAIIFGIVLFHEVLTGWHVLGLATILCGVFVAQPGPVLSLIQRIKAPRSDRDLTP